MPMNTYGFHTLSQRLDMVRKLEVEKIRFQLIRFRYTRFVESLETLNNISHLDKKVLGIPSL